MRFFNIKPNLLMLFLFILLIMQPIGAVPPQELYGEPCQTYTALCIISFFMGTMLYVFIHNCCSYQPTLSSIPPAYDKESIEKELMEKLQAIINNPHNEQSSTHTPSTTNKKNRTNKHF